MKKTMKKLLAILLSAILILGLSGCAPKFDASQYMQAELDLLTRHNIDQYIDIMGVTETEAKDIYEEALQGITASLSDLRTLGLPEDLVHEYELWMIDILVNTKYTVLEEKQDGDAYIVPIEVEPIRAFANVSDRLTTEVTAYMEELVTSMMNGGAEPTEEEINNWVFTKLLEIVKENLENPSYGEIKTFEITIEKNADGLYEPNAEQSEELGMNHIDLSDINELM